MSIFRDFLRRLFGKASSSSAERESSQPAATPGNHDGPSRVDEELKQRFDDYEKEALEQISRERANGSASAGKRRRLPRPTDVKQLGNSPMVAFSNGKAMVIMDWDAFDYTYGDVDGPDPTQRDLDALLARATRVCVLAGAMFRGRAMGGPVLLDAHDPQALRELAACLQIVEDPRTFGHCHCLGGPTIEFYAGLEHLATIGLQHGRAIRWKEWYHDAQLKNGDRLTHWLQDHGVKPSELAAIYQRGDNYLFGESGGRQQEAQRLCEKAQELAQHGNLTEALQLCTRALDLDADCAETYALRGLLYWQARRIAEAAVDCSAAIDRGVRQENVYFVRAIALGSTGRIEEAIADCSMALHLNPDSASPFNSRGLFRAQPGRLKEAWKDYAEAIRLAPQWFLPYSNRAQLAHSQGKLDAALADYDRAVELVKETAPPQTAAGADHEVAVLYCRRGDLCYDLFREADADIDFAEARRHHPVTAANYLGEMWLRRGNLDRALEAFTQLVQLCPQDARAHVGHGLAQEALATWSKQQPITLPPFTCSPRAGRTISFVHASAPQVHTGGIKCHSRNVAAPASIEASTTCAAESAPKRWQMETRFSMVKRRLTSLVHAELLEPMSRTPLNWFDLQSHAYLRNCRFTTEQF